MPVVKERPKKVAIPKREPGKKTDTGIFDNMRPLHPIEEIMGFAAQSPSPPASAPAAEIGRPNAQASNHPSVQVSNSPNAQVSNLDAQPPSVDTQASNLVVQPPNLGAQASTGQGSLPFKKADHEYPSRQGVARVHARIPEDLHTWTRSWCLLQRPKIDLQDLIRHLLEQHREAVLGAQMSNRPGAHDHDQDRINRLFDRIMELEPLDVYKLLTGNEIVSDDRAAFERVKDFWPNEIKYGIVYSVRSVKGKMKYFSYCLKAIEDAHNNKRGDYLESEIIKLIESGRAPLI